MRTPRGMANGTNAPGGWKRCVPMIEIGTTRTPARLAIVKGPFLKSAMRPSLERVPSGKAMRLFPACREATASRKVSICDLRSLRRSGMCRANCIAQPMSGIRRISILEMYLTCGQPGGLSVRALCERGGWCSRARARVKAVERAGRGPCEGPCEG